MDTANLLPHVNATLNAAACALLVVGRVQISRGRIEQHRAAMISALTVSVLFLASYLTYHFTAPIFVFRGEGVVRPIYYALLISHVVLAALAIPMIFTTAWLGLRRADNRHRRLAGWTWLLWMYVSLSGVLVYLMLYQLF